MNFSELPEPIRDWLSSSTISLLIEKLNDKYDIPVEKESVIATMILELAVGELKASNFINELGLRLSMDIKKSSDVAKEIDQKIVRSIEQDLRRIGIEVGFLSSQSSAKAVPPPGQPPLKKQPPGIASNENRPVVTEPQSASLPKTETSQSSIAAKALQPQQQPVRSSKPQLKNRGDQPFLVYHEQRGVGEVPESLPTKPAEQRQPEPQMRPTQSNEKQPTSGSNANINIPIRTNQALTPPPEVARPTPPPTLPVAPPRPISRPPSARPTPKPPSPPPIASPTATRIVHYSNYLTQFKDKGVIV
ncbi:MAG: hypothetical protein Q8O87_03160 [bacterium]|nr:hypothetical protein [bacterium]